MSEFTFLFRGSDPTAQSTRGNAEIHAEMARLVQGVERKGPHQIPWTSAQEWPLLWIMRLSDDNAEFFWTKGEFTEGHELDPKWLVPKEMDGVAL